MRKFIAWPIAWTLFWIGHCTSVVFLRHDWTFMYAAFRLYQWVMQTSVGVQDWALLRGPWEVPDNA
jgi:hypothetical protein